MRRSLLAVVLLVVTAAAAPSPVLGKEAVDRLKMKLRVSTHSGPNPLSLDLTGSFTGAEPSEISACFVTVERTYTTPGGTDLISKDELPCLEPGPEAPAASVPASFKKSFTLKEPGLYSYRMILIGTDGKRMASTSQEVKVYKGRVEVGVTGTRVTNRR